MTANASQIGFSQDLLAVLDRVYRGRTIQRDVLGRRSALPSEIARLLAQSTDDPSSSRPLAGRAGFTITFEQNISEG